jgi:N-methylhydantoinase A/oxoprolinase/acetone carboxylase beta subunit
MLAGPREMVGAQPIAGPALVTDYGSTTMVPPGWTMRGDSAGNLVIRHK